MNKKVLLSILAGASTTGGSFLTFPHRGTSPLETNLIPIFPTSSEHVIKIGDQSKKLEDLIKEYLKTITGAKQLANVIASSLAVDFIDNRGEDASALGDRLKNELSGLRSTNDVDTLGSEEKKKALFEFENDPDLHKNYHVFRKILKKFPEVLSEFLRGSIKEDKSSLDNDKSSDAKLKDLGKFLDSVLDDYLDVEKPLLIRRVTWKYDSTKDAESKIKDLFDEGESLPKDFTIPTAGSYFFPVFSDETEKKFSNFIDKHSDATQNLSELSDISETNYVVPVSGALSPLNTSQHSIAILELLAHAMSYEQWNESNKGTNKDNLSTKYTGSDKNICSNNSSGNKIPTISSGDLSSDNEAKKLSKVFCVEKGKNPYKTQKTQDVSDFFYLKKSNQTEKKPNNWIVYKDIHGVHAISIDPSIDNGDLKVKTKKKLLEIAAESSSSGFKWDINRELGAHLEKHFTRLFLDKYDEIAKKVDSSGEEKFKELVKALVKLLNSEVYSESIRRLRSNIFKDYANMLVKMPSRVDGNFKYINPALGWAGKLPYKPGEKFLKDSDSNNGTFKGHKFVFDFFEKIYLSEFKKLNGEHIKVNEKFKETAKETKFDDKIDGLLNSITSSKVENTNSFRIKKNGSDSKSTTKFKNLNVHSVLNMVWNSSLQDRSIVDYLIQTEIKDGTKGKLLFFDWGTNDKKFKESGVEITGTTKDLFDGTSNNEVFKTIVKNYLLSKHLDKFTESYDMNVNAPNGEMELTDFSNQDKLLELLKKIDIQEKKLFGSSEVDLLAKDNVEMFSELVAIRFLAENKLDNFRKYLRGKVSRDSFSGFVFSRKFEAKGVCEPLEENPTDSDAKNLKFETGRTWELKNGYLGYGEDQKIKDLNCILKSDLFNVSKAKLIKTDGNKSSDFYDLIGHRGLYSENIKDIFPQEIIDLISAKAVIWSGGESLIQYVSSLKSEEELKGLISKLKSQFTNVDWSIVEQDRMVDYSNVSYDWNSTLAKRLETKGEKISFEERKTILLNFLKQNDPEAFKLDHSWDKLKQLQTEWKSNSGKKNVELLKGNSFNRFYGWIKDGGDKYLVEDREKNRYSIFFIQIRFDDLENEEKWTKFLKEMPDDLIFKEVIRAAKEKEVQNTAMHHYLQESTSKMNGFTAYDERLRGKLDFRWLK